MEVAELLAVQLQQMRLFYCEISALMSVHRLRYGLDDLGMESRDGQISSPQRSDRLQGPSSHLFNGA